MQSASNAQLRARRWARNPLLALVMLAGLLAGLVALNTSAGADTTVQPSGPGQVLPGAEYLVRDSQATVDVTPGAFMYSRSSSTSNFSATSPALGALVCRGDTGPINALGNGNTSPRTEVTVTGPSGFSPVTFLSPSREVGITSGPFQTPEPYQPLANQANGPNNWRGGVPPTNSSNTVLGPTTAVPNPGLGFQETLDLAGAPAGLYTVTTVHKDIVRTGTFGQCTLGYPNQTGFGSQTPIPIPTFGNTFTAGNRTVVHKFEYRPWQYEFRDVLGNGGVNFNITPVAESQFSIVPENGPRKFSSIKAGGMRFYELPIELHVPLPSNPLDCIPDLAGCLPSVAFECDPGDEGCDPRLVWIDRYEADGERLVGLFDLETGAYIAYTATGGSRVYQFSLGTELDELYHTTLDQLAEKADSLGIDLPTILGTKVILRNGMNQLSLSLLNGLQFDPSELPGGIEIVTDFGVQAGIMIHTYAQATDTPCAAREASSEDGDTSWTRSVPVGYDVGSVPLTIPQLEAPGVPLPIGGQVFLIEGSMTGVGTNSATVALLGADVDSPGPDYSSIPLWVLPTDALLRSHSPRHFEYLGTAAWSTSEEPGEDGGCLSSGGFTGIGVMIDNPLVRLPIAQLLAKVDNPTVNHLLAQITAAVVEAGAPVLENPTIADLLETLTETVLDQL